MVYRCGALVLRLLGAVAALEAVGFDDFCVGHSHQKCLGGRSKSMSSSNFGVALGVAPRCVTPMANSLGRQARLRLRLCHSTHPATVLITLWCLVEEP